MRINTRRKYYHSVVLIVNVCSVSGQRFFIHDPVDVLVQGDLAVLLLVAREKVDQITFESGNKKRIAAGEAEINIADDLVLIINTCLTIFTGRKPSGLTSRRIISIYQCPSSEAPHEALADLYARLCSSRIPRIAHGAGGAE